MAPPADLASRAEHIGSLLRPPTLLEQRQLFLAHKCTAAELIPLENRAVKAVVKMQQEVGLHVITDGEMRRSVYSDGMFEGLEGMTFRPRPLSDFKPYLPFVPLFHSMGMKEYPSAYVTSKIKWIKSIHGAEFDYVKALVAPDDVKNIKVTICGISQIHIRHSSDKLYDKSVYKSDEEYFADLARAYRAEIDDLYARGCRRIQFDEPQVCFFCSDAVISGMKAVGDDHEALLDLYINAYNDVLRNRPSDLTVGIHMCRGNMRGAHFVEGSYVRIAGKLLKNMDMDLFYLEYDNERSGDFEPLRHLPPHKVVVLGLVSTKHGMLESLDELKERVHLAADIISQGTPVRTKADALNQICISPQCGFASVMEGNPITEEDERKKLALVVAAAQAIWG